MFENHISSVISELKSSYGKDFLDTITLNLHNIIKADYTFIARLDLEKHTSNTLSLATNSGIAENFSYELQDTPCDDVSNDDICIYPKGICGLYPKDQLLVDMEIEGYIGSPLHDSKGQVFAILVALFKREITNTESITNLFQLFSGRIAAELERSDHEQALTRLNNELENIIEQRTQALTEALDHLSDTKDMMIEQETMASLGNLVAGVSHEINTPLGIAVLCSSHMKSLIGQLKKASQGSSLKRSDIDNFLNQMENSEQSLSFNLDRAAELINNFRQVATERNEHDLVPVNLTQWMPILISSLEPMVKSKGVQLSTTLPDEVATITTVPSKLAQVITNLITNAVIHGFTEDKVLDNEQARIDLNLTVRSNGLIIEIKDNGIGIPESMQKKIFEPFFTTKRNKGGTGLGLSIVNNLVREHLHGKLTMTSSENHGTCFQIELNHTKDH